MKNTLKRTIDYFYRKMVEECHNQRLFVPAEQSEGYSDIDTAHTTLTQNGYKPWLADGDFLGIFDNVKNYTLVDGLRMYELYKLSTQCLSSHEGSLLEVGVYKGGSGALLTQVAKKYNRRVFLADTFQGIAKAAVEHDPHHKDGDYSDTSMEGVDNYLKRLQLNNYTILKGIFPDATSHLVPDTERFCFCHIDVDVYYSAKHIVEWIWYKLAIGGVIVFDDYGWVGCAGIAKYVDEELSKKLNNIFVHNINGQAIVVKTAD